MLDCLAACSVDLLAASLLCCRTAPLQKCTSSKGSCTCEHDIHAAACVEGVRGLTSSELPSALVQQACCRTARVLHMASKGTLKLSKKQ